MSERQLEPWGGEVHMPRWLRKALHRPEPPGNTPEAAHEARKPNDGPSVLESADRAGAGPLTQLYAEGRAKRPLDAGRKQR
jgi:hypothetical protein